MLSSMYKCCRGYTVGVDVRVIQFWSCHEKSLNQHVVHSCLLTQNGVLESIKNTDITINTAKYSFGYCTTTELIPKDLTSMFAFFYLEVKEQTFRPIGTKLRTHSWYISEGRHDNACASIQIAAACR